MELSARASDGDVSVLRWPRDARVRDHLVTVGQPRLLLVDHGTAPPEPVDDLEDWMRPPADPEDVPLRVRALQRRAPQPAPLTPLVDREGLLRVGERWIDLTPAQIPVVTLLVEHLERVVPYDSVAAAYARRGGSRHAASIRTVLARVAARVRPVGLELVTVRRRGVLLTQRRAR